MGVNWYMQDIMRICIVLKNAITGPAWLPPALPVLFAPCEVFSARPTNRERYNVRNYIQQQKRPGQTYLILRLPRIALLLDPLHLSFEVFCFDIDLSEPR